MNFIPKKIIYGCEARGDHDSPYLTRWTIFDALGVRLYLHKFHRSDHDDLHDHPWAFASLILWRGYVEETPCGICKADASHCRYRVRERKRPGMILFRRANHAHRVVLIDDKPSWSLVIAGRRKREWGFFTRRGWQQWMEYFTEKGC